MPAGPGGCRWLVPKAGVFRVRHGSGVSLGISRGIRGGIGLGVAMDRGGSGVGAFPKFTSRQFVGPVESRALF